MKQKIEIVEQILAIRPAMSKPYLLNLPLSTLRDILSYHVQKAKLKRVANE